ncbi:pilin, partial [Patescibacteria group bacterium]|nr:pilin [Patescibacteria group bacterium]
MPNSLKTRKFRRTFSCSLFSVWAALLFAIPVASAQTCCQCNPPENPKAVVCVKTEKENCGEMVTKASNTDVENLINCTESQNDTQCQAINKGGLCSKDPVDEKLYKSETPTIAAPAEAYVVTPPKLGIDIPDLIFATKIFENEGKLEIPFLAQYISAVYKYLTGIAIVAAAIMLVYGGFLYIVGSASSQITRGKEIIKDAIIGLILIICSYSILSTINPATTTLQGVVIKTIPAEQLWFKEHGTGDPVYSPRAIQGILDSKIPGRSTQVKTAEKPESLAQVLIPAASAAVAQNIMGGSAAYLSILKADDYKKMKRAPQKMNAFCTTEEEASQATTYEAKIELLAKAILGWAKICNEEHKCAYCQTCQTGLPDGSPAGGGAPNFIANTLSARGKTIAWPKACQNAWDNSHDVSKHKECEKPAQDAYKKYFIDNLAIANLYGTDCSGFAFHIYRCTNAAFTMPPNATFKSGPGVNPYLDPRDVGKFDKLPTFVFSAHWADKDLPEKAKKMKFGDIGYICCGAVKKPGKKEDPYSAHWFIYTGGRPDVPFSFIEMGGLPNDERKGGAEVPGFGNVPGVELQPKDWTLMDYLKPKMPQEDVCANCQYWDMCKTC